MSDPARRDVTVLHVDDDPDFGALSKEFLQRVNDEFTVVTERSVTAGLETLATREFDCVVSDYDMSRTNGLEFLEAVRAEHPDLPFILFTGKGSEEIASEAITAGVTDYIQKEGGGDQYLVLANRIANAVEAFRARQAYDEQSEHYRTVVERSHDAIYIYRNDGFLFVNQQACVLTGYSKSELLGHDIWSVVHPDDRDHAREIARDREITEDAPTTYEMRIVRKDGSVRSCEFSVQQITYEGEYAVLGSVRDVTERERVNSRLRLLNQYSHDVTTLVDRDGTIRYDSPSVERVLGYEQGELVGERAEHYIHPEDRQRVADGFADLLADETETATVSYRFRHAEGSWRTLETTATNRLDDLEIGGIILNSRDVTEQTRIREERNEILERMTDAFFALDDRWRFTYLNRRALELFQVERATALDSTIWEVFPEAADSAFSREYRRAMAEQKSVGLTSYYEPLDAWFEAQAYPSENGLSVFVRDVSRRKRQEQVVAALHDATRRLMHAETPTEVCELGVQTARDVLGYQLNGIWLYDESESALQPVTTTDESAEVVGTMPVYCEGESLSWEAFTAGETRVFDSVGVEPDAYNSETVLESELIVPLGEYGVLNVGSLSADAFDEMDVSVTETLAANVEAALERAEREQALKTSREEQLRQNERLEEFAGVVSHDLRNPLNVASARLDLYRQSGEADHLEHVDRAHDRMERIIEDVLALSRQGQTVGERDRLDLRRLCETVWQTVETGDSTLGVTADLGVDGDPSRVQRLLANLFRNAVEHSSTNPDSRVHQDAVEHASTSPHDASPVTVRVGALEDGFYVEDDGPGIPPEERAKVFESGYSTDPEGTGFGLAIVRQIAGAHGWSVDVGEGARGGARFEITDVEVGDRGEVTRDGE